MIDAQRNASLLTRIGWRIEAAAWDAYAAWYKAKGIDRASDAAGDLLRIIGPLTPTQRIARINMQRCFPEAEKPEIDRLLGAMWENFGRLAGEIPETSDDGHSIATFAGGCVPALLAGASPGSVMRKTLLVFGNPKIWIFDPF